MRGEARAAELDHLPESTGFREVFRYRKDGRVRIYNLRVVADAAELWVASVERGKVLGTQKKATIDDPDHVAIFLEDVERTLTAGGWIQI